MSRYSGDLQRAEFVRADLSGAQFRLSELAGVVMRGVNLDGADIDGWVGELRIKGVDVGPLVEAELVRRDPARGLQHATDPAGLRAAWAGLEERWALTYDRVAGMPSGTVDLSVDGEWSFAETLRHLVFAIDGWLGHAVLGRPDPYHPWGVPFTEFVGEAASLGIDVSAAPSYPEVLQMRADRVATVRDFLATVTPEQLSDVNGAPAWEGENRFPALTCLHVIINEEWEHHRMAQRDLDLIKAESPLVGRPATWREA